MTSLKFAITATLIGFVAVAAVTASDPEEQTGPLPFSYLRGEPLHIGNEVQYLMDDYIVEDRWKLTRKVGKVVKHLRNPVLLGDKPWEGASVGGHPSVLYDDRLHKYRMWYACFDISSYFTRQAPPYAIGYAESEDGFNWTKPELEGFPFHGYPRTNIVTAGRGNRWAAAPQVQLNPDQSDPQKRFMMVYVGGPVDLAYSPDGLHWTVVEKPLLPYHSDFPNHLLWVPESHLWYLYERPSVLPNGRGILPEGRRHTGRRLALSTSKDLENWSQPRTIFYPDERGELDYDSARVFRRHGLFLMLYAQMSQETGKSETEAYIATSRDGVRWERTWDRQPLIPRGVEGTFDHGQVGVGPTPPIDIGEDMLIYYYASPAGQSDWVAETGVGVARLRKDRFVGQWADDQTGYLVTRQFVLEGSKLKINCSSLPGLYYKNTDGIRVAIIEAPDFKTKETTWEKAIPGYTLEDSDTIVTDNTAHTVTWKGKSDLSALKGKAVYLRFQMKRAGLYTFQIAP